jgi:hypothetical protein
MSMITRATMRSSRALNDWSLSPAYDLTPAVPVSLERRDLAMECGDAGRYANAENLLSQSARFLLDLGEARALVDAMEAQVRGSWYAIARAAGVSDAGLRQDRLGICLSRLPPEPDLIQASRAGGIRS